jgi:hypothetical protein
VNEVAGTFDPLKSASGYRVGFAPGLHMSQQSALEGRRTRGRTHRRRGSIRGQCRLICGRPRPPRLFKGSLDAGDCFTIELASDGESVAFLKVGDGVHGSYVELAIRGESGIGTAEFHKCGLGSLHIGGSELVASSQAALGGLRLDFHAGAIDLDSYELRVVLPASNKQRHRGDA